MYSKFCKRNEVLIKLSRVSHFIVYVEREISPLIMVVLDTCFIMKHGYGTSTKTLNAT